MSMTIHFHGMKRAVAVNDKIDGGDDALWIVTRDGDGNRVVVFLHEVEQAQKLRDAAQEALDILEAREDNDG